MTIRDSRREVEQRPLELTQRIHALSDALSLAAVRGHDRRCVVCAEAACTNQLHFILPIGYIATHLVLNDLDKSFHELPLQYGFLCRRHTHHFSCLFADIGDFSLNLERLECRATTLRAVQRGQLLVFGGPKAVTLVENFHTSLVELKKSLAQTKTKSWAYHPAKLSHEAPV